VHTLQSAAIEEATLSSSSTLRAPPAVESTAHMLIAGETNVTANGANIMNTKLALVGTNRYNNFGASNKGLQK
jgi:hypothetical protein